MSPSWGDSGGGPWSAIKKVFFIISESWSWLWMAALPLFRCLIIGRRCTGGGWRDYCRWNAPDFPAACVVMVHYGLSDGRAGGGQDHHVHRVGQPRWLHHCPSCIHPSIRCRSAAVAAAASEYPPLACRRVDIHSFLLLAGSHRLHGLLMLLLPSRVVYTTTADRNNQLWVP